MYVLAQARPEIAAPVIYNLLKRHSTEELKEYSARRNVVHALDFLLLFAPTFEKAAWSLFLLAEAENETWANNSTGLLGDAFHFFSQSEMPFEKKFGVYKALLAEQASDSTGEAILLSVLNEMLETQHSYSTTPDEMIALASLPYTKPKLTVKNRMDAHISVWNFAVEQASKRTAKARETIASSLCRHLRTYLGLLGTQALQDIKNLYSNGDIPKGKLLKTLTTIIHYDLDGHNAEIAAAVKELRTSLEGRSFTERLERYVKFQIFEEEFSESKGETQNISSQTVHLAEEIISDPSLLIPELSWLTTKEAENAPRLGYELGIRDTNYKLWPLLKENQKSPLDNGSPLLIGRYLGGVADRKEYDTHYKMLCELREDSLFDLFLIDIIWRSYLDDKVGLLVADIIESGQAPYHQLYIMSMGRSTERLSAHVIDRWLDFLLSVNEPQAGEVAVSLVYHYLNDDRANPRKNIELAVKAANHPCLFKEYGERDHNNNMTTYYWGGLARSILKNDKNAAKALFAKCIESFGNRGSILDNFYDRETTGFLTEFVNRFPDIAWEIIEPALSDDNSAYGKSYHLLHWFSGKTVRMADEAVSKGAPLEVIPYGIYEKWIEKDRQNRALKFAFYFLKPLYDYSVEELADRNSLIAKFTATYGANPEIRGHLAISPFGEMWSGPESSMVAKKIEWIDRALAAVTEENLRSTLLEMREHDEKWQLNAKRAEERDDFYDSN